jgi:hypothetical protein
MKEMLLKYIDYSIKYLRKAVRALLALRFKLTKSCMHPNATPGLRVCPDCLREIPDVIRQEIQRYVPEIFIDVGYNKDAIQVVTHVKLHKEVRDNVAEVAAKFGYTVVFVN